MKLTFKITLFILLMSGHSFAQNQLDSLWGVWENNKQEDEIRLIALCEYAEVYSNKDLDSSLYFAKKAFDYAESKGLKKYSCKSKEIIGHAYYRKGDLVNSYDNYLKAIEIARQIEDLNIVATSIYSIGTIYYSKGEYDKALEYYFDGLSIMETLDNSDGMSDILNNIGIIHIIQKNHSEAETSLNRSILLGEETGNQNSGAITNLAILKKRQGDYSGAIELYMKGLRINEQSEDRYSMAYSHSNIANLYFNQNDMSKFFEHMNKSLEIRRSLGDMPGVAKCLSNLGAAYLKEENISKSEEILSECLHISEEIGNKTTQAHSLRQLGLIQMKLGNKELALDYLYHGLKLNEELGGKVGIARSLKALGNYYMDTKDEQRAIKYFSKSLKIAKETDIELTQEVAFELYEAYGLIGNSAKALNAYELYISAKDSINHETNQREMIRQEYKYAYDTKLIADSISFASKREIEATKLKQAKNQRQSLFIVLLVLLGFTALLFNRIRLINKQKHTIKEQNHELNHLNENLEQKVEDRTQKIVEINNNLKKSDERYTYALEASNDGIWDYNVNEDKISFSPAIYTMLGFEPFEFPEAREGIYALLHSDELKIEKRKSHNLFLIQNEEEFLLDEYRLLKKDGEISWIQVKGKVVEKDENGKALRIVGTHTDITADKLKNQKLLEAVLKTEDAERSRISKDIHDGLQQTLTISLLNFQNIKKDLQGLGSKTIEKFNIGWKYLQESIVESRNVAHTLMPKAIVDFGILAAFESLIDAVDKSNEATSFHFSHNLKSKKLSNQQIEITLYRILQEAFNNINKYAKASNVYIQLKEYDDIFMLTIEDDGQGFDYKTIKEKGSGLGLKSMQNRLDAVNGSLVIDSAIGRGTAILVEIEKIT